MLYDIQFVPKYTWLYLIFSLQTHTHTHTHQNKPEEDRCMHEWCSVTHCNHFNIGSVQFSGSVASNSLWPHGLQHTRPPCPSPTPGVYLNSCPLSRLCFPLGWTGWISLQSKGLSRVFSNTTVQKHQFFGAQLSL